MVSRPTAGGDHLARPPVRRTLERNENGDAGLHKIRLASRVRELHHFNRRARKPPLAGPVPGPVSRAPTRARRGVG